MTYSATYFPATLLRNGGATFIEMYNQVLTGKINKSTCTYKTPFKEGKMVIFADLSNPAGIHQTATLKLSTSAGNTTIIYTSLERPNIRIQLTADKFEELKN